MAEISKQVDIIVIGGGPAGYVAAIQAARCGASTMIIEKDVVGGTCLNRGCIPTKYYLKSAEMLLELKHAAKRGIMFNDTSSTMDMKTAIKGKDSVVRKLTGGVKSLLISNGVEIVSGTGKLISPNEVEIDGKQRVGARAVILAGGSKVSRIPIEGIDTPKVLTSDDILDIEEIPSRLAVIGGGVIGVEMGVIFQAFGSQVTIIELAQRILPFMDEEVSAALHKELKKTGIDIRTGVSLEKILDEGEGLQLILSDGKSVEADRALLSIGRSSDLSCIEEGLVATERGKVIANEYGESSLPGVYAIGDINGQKMLAHAAYKMGERAAHNASSYLGIIDTPKEALDLRYVPSAVYCMPEVGCVGMSEEEAAAAGKISIGRFPLSANGRALAAGAPAGFVKVIADANYGRILGVHIVGHGASEIINEAAALMAMEITVHEVADCVHGHPTVGEALAEAAADCLSHCLHLPPR